MNNSISIQLMICLRYSLNRKFWQRSVYRIIISIIECRLSVYFILTSLKMKYKLNNISSGTQNQITSNSWSPSLLLLFDFKRSNNELNASSSPRVLVDIWSWDGYISPRSLPTLLIYELSTFEYSLASSHMICDVFPNCPSLFLNENLILGFFIFLNNWWFTCWLRLWLNSCYTYLKVSETHVKIQLILVANFCSCKSATYHNYGL